MQKKFRNFSFFCNIRLPKNRRDEKISADRALRERARFEAQAPQRAALLEKKRLETEEEWIHSFVKKRSIEKQLQLEQHGGPPAAILLRPQPERHPTLRSGSKGRP